MKKKLCFLLLVSFQITHAWTPPEIIKIKPENSKSLGHVVDVSENVNVKGYYFVKVTAPHTGKSDSVYSTPTLRLLKKGEAPTHEMYVKGEIILELKPHVSKKIRRDYENKHKYKNKPAFKTEHEITFMVKKENINEFHLSIRYAVDNRTSHGPGISTVTYDAKSFHYELSLKDFKPKK